MAFNLPCIALPNNDKGKVAKPKLNQRLKFWEKNKFIVSILLWIKYPKEKNRKKYKALLRHNISGISLVISNKKIEILYIIIKINKI